MTPIGAQHFIDREKLEGYSLVAIYGLFDSAHCFYVGQTRRPHHRFQSHACRMVPKPERMVILDFTIFERRYLAEGRWIDFFKSIGQAEVNKPTAVFRSLEELKDPYNPQNFTALLNRLLPAKISTYFLPNCR